MIEKREQRKKRRKERREKEEQDLKAYENLVELLGKATFFAGSLEEYERFVGYPCEIISTGMQEQYIFFHLIDAYNFFAGDTMEFLVGFNPEADYSGLEALVNFQNSVKAYDENPFCTGLPVRKKDKRW